jgi:hypothetical protein
VNRTRESHLILFVAGGRRFAAEAQTLLAVGAAGSDSGGGERGRVRNLGALLDLPCNAGTRTLLVETDFGFFGFIIDEVAREQIAAHPVIPVPALLRQWMKLPAVSGFTQDEGQRLTNVLDLKVLANLASELARRRTEGAP